MQQAPAAPAKHGPFAAQGTGKRRGGGQKLYLRTGFPVY
jgi:hypothetical protein